MGRKEAHKILQGWQKNTGTSQQQQNKELQVWGRAGMAQEETNHKGVGSKKNHSGKAEKKKEPQVYVSHVLQ